MTILLPIGHDLGTIYTDDQDDPHAHHVRVGPEIIGLNEFEYGLWRALVDVDDGGNQTPSSLSVLLRESGASDYRNTLDQLTRARLVATVLPVGATAKRFTQTHRLFPLARAVGNSPEDQKSFRIYLGDERVLEISWVMYYLWSMSPTHTDLAEGIALASAEQREQAPSGEAKTEDHIRTVVLEALPTLLAHGCAYLDVTG